MALQGALLALGLEVPGGADGIFGKGTAEALKHVQSTAGIEATGLADKETLMAMDKRLRAKSQR
jgi:peptidoglycan hydrolase-like protein with peptidoglycan-binding domain